MRQEEIDSTPHHSCVGGSGGGGGEALEKLLWRSEA